MPYFRVLLNGENFWLPMDGKPSRLGFFTTRFVEAGNESDAELMALAMLREDSSLKGVLNEVTDPPMIYCDEIEEIEPFQPASVVQQGFTFYPEESNG